MQNNAGLGSVRSLSPIIRGRSWNRIELQASAVFVYVRTKAWCPHKTVMCKGASQASTPHASFTPFLFSWFSYLDPFSFLLCRASPPQIVNSRWQHNWLAYASLAWKQIKKFWLNVTRTDSERMRTLLWLHLSLPVPFTPPPPPPLPSLRCVLVPHKTVQVHFWAKTGYTGTKISSGFWSVKVKEALSYTIAELQLCWLVNIIVHGFKISCKYYEFLICLIPFYTQIQEEMFGIWNKYYTIC